MATTSQVGEQEQMEVTTEIHTPSGPPCPVFGQTNFGFHPSGSLDSNSGLKNAPNLWRLTAVRDHSYRDKPDADTYNKGQAALARARTVLEQSALASEASGAAAAAVEGSVDLGSETDAPIDASKDQDSKRDTERRRLPRDAAGVRIGYAIG